MGAWREVSMNETREKAEEWRGRRELEFSGMI